MDSEEIKLTARKYALQNAVQFNGTANLKAVAGRVISENRSVSPKEIYQISGRVVAEVNKLSLDKQQLELEKLAPELLIKEKKIRDFSLPDLPNAIQGKVVTRFPPEPNGYLHIGHAKAAIVDFEYAKKYEGQFILRFDDTNPEKDKEEFYHAQEQDLSWLDISWDKKYHTSDNLEKHYTLASQLIQQGDGYVCLCDSSEIKKGRQQKKNCPCRQKSSHDHIALWEKLLSSSLESGIVRLKADMQSDNTAMRDPTLFRIINTPHPLQKDRYHIWPTYDFAGAVEDSVSGVTHPFRTKEYELRDEVYFYLLDKLQLRKPHLMEFARLSIDGMPISKRLITPLIEKGLVSGFDDVRLPTLQGLRRRGIVPKAIKNFVFSQGISKVESIVPFSLVESENRKVIDATSKRLYFVPNPHKLIVSNAPEKETTLAFHPSDHSLGNRLVKTMDTFYISSEDAENLSINDVFRLKGLFNVKLEKKNDELIGSYSGDEVIADSLKVQWVTPESKQLIIYKPNLLYINNEFNTESLQEISGRVEQAIHTLQDGESIQFERFGFVRIEKKQDSIKGFFTHR